VFFTRQPGPGSRQYPVASPIIYLDNNATTAVDPGALAAMTPFFSEQFANPSGAYSLSRSIRPAIEKARAQVAGLFGCSPEETVFTSGGTESDTTAIRSALQCFPERRHLVTCATEHPAVLVPLENLRSQGYELTVLGVSEDGRIDLDELRTALRPGETALVSLMWANNETGVLQPVIEAAEITAEAGALFHTDSVQAAGKLLLDLAGTKVHYAALSGHKLHGPKGIGALYISEDVRFHPLLTGGGQEGDRRSGTENVPGIVGLGAAAEAAMTHLRAVQERCEDPVAGLRDRLESTLINELDGIHPNGDPKYRTPNTSSLRFDGIEAEGLLILLDKASICASAGSACHTGSLKPSAVLTAMGLDAREARSTLRLSLSRFTTADDIERASGEIVAAVRKLRSLRPAAGVVSTSAPASER